MKPRTVGLVIAGLYIIFKMVLFIAHRQYDVLFGKAAMILMGLVMTGIFYSINHYIRNTDTYDWMTAFKKGITVSLIASLVTGLFLFIYYKAIDSFYLEELAITEYNKVKSFIKPEQLDEYNKGLKNKYTANFLATATTGLVNIVGLFSSLTVAFLGRMVIKRKA